MHRLVKIGLVVLLVWFVVKNPHEAASLTVSIGHGLSNAATGFGTFVSSSVKGLN